EPTKGPSSRWRSERVAPRSPMSSRLPQAIRGFPWSTASLPPALRHRAGDRFRAAIRVALVVTLVLSIAVAAASYYVVERPLLRLKYRRLTDLTGRRRPARAQG